MQLGILIETMRREGFELSVSRPRGSVPSTTELAACSSRSKRSVIDLDTGHSGIVVQKLSERRAELVEMRPSGGGRQRLVLLRAERVG